MPRRHKNQGSTGRQGKPSGPSKSSRPSSHALKSSHKTKGKTYDDKIYDAEDAFHEGRDEILFEGRDRVRGRDLEDFDDEEEVFALRGLDDSDNSDSSDQDFDDSASEDSESAPSSKSASATQPKPSKKTAKSKKNAEDDESAADDDSEDEERWGRNKSAYYASNGPEAESDDEEAQALEEAEVIRLQAKSREGVSEDDFGLNDWKFATVPGPTKSTTTKSTKSISLTTPLTNPLDNQSLVRDLERNSPEVLALAREWDDIAPMVSKLRDAVQKKYDADPNHPVLGMYLLHQQTFMTYATVLSHYLYVRLTPTQTTSTATPSSSASTTQATSVPDKVLTRLYELRNALSILEDIGFSALGMTLEDPTLGSDIEGEDLEDDLDLDDEEMMVMGEGLSDDDLGSDFSGEDDEDYDEEEMIAAFRALEADKAAKEEIDLGRKKRMKVAAEKGKSDSHEKRSVKQKKVKKDNTEEKTKKKGKKEKKDAGMSKPVVFDLVEPEFGSYSASASTSTSSTSKPHPPSSSTISASTSQPYYDPYTELTSLSAPDAADKSARRHTLKFHTDKIESSVRRREKARERERALGGDDDLPWKERGIEKKKREDREAEKRAQKGVLGMGGDDLDLGGDVDGEVTGKGKKRARDDLDDGSGSDGGGSGEDDDGYYELVKREKKQAKIDKQAAYDAEREANRPDFTEDSDALSGPRSISRTMLKNRGMSSSSRSKKAATLNRNPRVKKKIRFEQAKKKVASKKAVFKGGLGSLEGGRYDGERSGISKVIKSVKLS